MTLTEATHALARRFAPGPSRPAIARERLAPAPAAERVRPVARGPIRLPDAMQRVEPSWVEAVAIVQAVCAQLPPGQAAPTIDSLVIAANGAVTFPPTAAADDHAAVRGAGQLLNAVLRAAGCPMPVWDATERALRTPATFGSAAAFGVALTSVPADDGVRELQRYYEAVVRPPSTSARAALAAFGASADGSPR